MLWYEIMMELGGRTLLTLLSIDVLLLTVLGILKTYGNIKNTRNRSKVSSRNRKWVNQTTSRRAKFDGLEILETHKQRLPARQDVQFTSYARPSKEIQFIRTTQFNGARGVIVNPDRTIAQVQHHEDELSKSTDSPRSLPSTLSNKQGLI